MAQKSSDLAGAIEVCTAAIKNEPNNSVLYARRAAFYSFGSNFATAAADAQQAAALTHSDSDRFSHLLNLAEYRAKAGHHLDAVDAYTKAFELAAKLQSQGKLGSDAIRVSLYVARGLSYEALGAPYRANARADYEKALDAKTPKDVYYAFEQTKARAGLARLK